MINDFNKVFAKKKNDVVKKFLESVFDYCLNSFTLQIVSLLAFDLPLNTLTCLVFDTA